MPKFKTQDLVVFSYEPDAVVNRVFEIKGELIRVVDALPRCRFQQEFGYLAPPSALQASD